MTVEGPLYHLALAQDWDAAQASGQYRISTRHQRLEDVGYIHTSFEHQVARTAARWFAEVEVDLVVLEIDPARVGSPVVVEAAVDGEGFPHLYGPLPVHAVTGSRPARMVDGRLVVEDGARGHHDAPPPGPA